MVDKSLEIAGRATGREIYVNPWAVEKLWKVAEAISLARGAEKHSQVEAWRNLAKLATWMAGNTLAYEEKAVMAAFNEGECAMLQHLEELLAPILRSRTLLRLYFP